MPLPLSLYEAALLASRPGVEAAALFNRKLKRGVRGRRESSDRLLAWGASSREPERPLVWVHAPSVGEGLMAQAIIRELRSARPDLQVAFTHFSPSAERIVADVGADVWGYVPWDTRRSVRPVLAALRPAAVVFVRTEVWPVLARDAAEGGARLLLVNAVLSEGSGRMSRPARSLMAALYGRLDGVGAVSEDHASRYVRLGVPPGRVRVTGDARFDQVWSRIEGRGLYGLRGADDAAHRVPEPLRPLWTALRDPAAFTVVAGSTWPADDDVILPAMAALRNPSPSGGARRLRLIAAPHEPTPRHLAALEQRLDRLGLPHARLTPLLDGGGPVPEAVIVDRMGVLADLYGLADAAYVGGGFGRAGLHSVVEPAALAVPVLFGPAHGNAREADDLARAGGGLVVRSAGDVTAALGGWLADPGSAMAAGARAREFVRGETGAAARNADLVAEFI
jgi:3-deoxy-D-manno-octulosonic-acid transferase